MFPLTEEERIARIRSKLETAEESAKAKRDVALANLDEATERWEEARGMLETFDEMAGVVAAARVACASVDVDQVTGEVSDGEEPPGVDGANDALLGEAIKLVVATGAATVSLVQRRLRIGYARAARLIHQMEALGVGKPGEDGGPRQVLITDSDIDAVVQRLVIDKIAHRAVDEFNRTAPEGVSASVVS
jgi:DNA segregation ATPase FtsK/SpoIIIE-like protein